MTEQAKTAKVIYIVREQSHSDNPADNGPELKRFKDWEIAKRYSEKLWTEDTIRSYVSEEYPLARRMK